MRLAPGWRPWVTAPAVGAVVALAIAIVQPWALAVAAALLLVALAMVGFFRDPERDLAGGIVAAADGRVRETDDTEVVTFLNIHNVHVVRAPYAGRVVAVQRFDGGHAPAFLETATHNAGLVLTLDTDWGLMDVRLVAGLVARQAVSFVEPGEEVRAGERIGMIRFSSRVDVDLPEGADLLVEPGQAVRAASSSIAEPPTEETGEAEKTP